MAKAAQRNDGGVTITAGGVSQTIPAGQLAQLRAEGGTRGVKQEVERHKRRVDDMAFAVRAAERKLNAAWNGKVEEIVKDAVQKGYDRGYRAGLERGREDVDTDKKPVKVMKLVRNNRGQVAGAIVTEETQD